MGIESEKKEDHLHHNHETETNRGREDRIYQQQLDVIQVRCHHKVRDGDQINNHQVDIEVNLKEENETIHQFA
jgi:hypothetical protein